MIYITEIVLGSALKLKLPLSIDGNCSLERYDVHVWGAQSSVVALES